VHRVDEFVSNALATVQRVGCRVYGVGFMGVECRDKGLDRGRKGERGRWRDGERERERWREGERGGGALRKEK